jgi:hypothetical protein
MVKPATVNRIRQLSRQGKSSNEIVRQLRREGIGIRRKTILAYAREFKGRKPKAEPYKYTPRKYRRKPTYPRGVVIARAEKHVAIYGKHNGISKRIEISGTGKYLQQVLYDAVHHPPKERFLRTNQRRFERSRDLSKDEWDDRPTIRS